MRKILVEGINIYAYHGCLPEEEKIGAEYIVDVVLDYDFSIAAKTDDLTKTINYAVVFDIVKKHMQIRSNLIEHVGQRIVDEIKIQFLGVDKIEVKIAKLRPPMDGNVKSASIVIIS